MRNRRILLLIPLLLLVLIVVGGTLAVSAPAEAFELQLQYPEVPGTDGTLNDLVDPDKNPGWLTIPNIVIFIFQAAIWIGSIIATISLVYVGFRFATSAGDPMQRTKAKSRLKGITFGMLLLVGSFFLVDIINPELSSLRIFQQGLCSEDNRSEGCDNTTTIGFDDTAEETGGLVVYDGENFTGSSQTIISSIPNAIFALSGISGNPRGLKKATSGVIINSLRLAPECIATLYEKKDFTGKRLIINTLPEDFGTVTINDEFGSHIKTIEIPWEGGDHALLLRTIKHRLLIEDGNWWEDDVDSIKLLGCKNLKGVVLHEDKLGGDDGRQETFIENKDNLKTSFVGNDQTTYIEIYGDMVVSFYEDSGFEKKELKIEILGGEVIQCLSTDLENLEKESCMGGGGYEEKSNHIKIQNLKDINLTKLDGEGKKTGNEGDDKWNDKISSLRIEFTSTSISSDDGGPPPVSSNIKLWVPFATPNWNSNESEVTQQWGSGVIFNMVWNASEFYTADCEVKRKNLFGDWFRILEEGYPQRPDGSASNSVTSSASSYQILCEGIGSYSGQTYESNILTVIPITTEPPPTIDAVLQSSQPITLLTIAAEANPSLVSWSPDKRTATVRVKSDRFFDISWYRTSGESPPPSTDPYAGTCTLMKWDPVALGQFGAFVNRSTLRNPEGFFSEVVNKQKQYIFSCTGQSGDSTLNANTLFIEPSL